MNRKYKKGFEEGYKNGFTLGYKEAKSSIEDEVFDSGFMEGYGDGYNDGCVFHAREVINVLSKMLEKHKLSSELYHDMKRTIATHFKSLEIRHALQGDDLLTESEYLEKLDSGIFE